MKKFIGSLILIGMTMTAWACDQCSVNVGSGVLSEGHYIGYRFKYRRQFIDRSSELGFGKHLDHVKDQGTVQELYYSHEIYANYRVWRNWHLMAAIPLVNNYRSISGTTSQDIYGFSDPWLMVRNQKIWQKEDMKFILSGGLGVKLPMGNIHKEYKGAEADLDMQPGTGSMDFLSNLVLVYEYKRILIVNQTNVKLNGMSPDAYRYGNSLASSLELGYTLVNKGAESWRLNLLLGPYLELIGRDEQSELRQGEESLQLFGSGTLQLRKERWLLSAQGQTELYSKMDDRMLPTTERLSIGLQYDF